METSISTKKVSESLSLVLIHLAGSFVEWWVFGAEPVTQLVVVDIELAKDGVEELAVSLP